MGVALVANGVVHEEAAKNIVETVGKVSLPVSLLAFVADPWLQLVGLVALGTALGGWLGYMVTPDRDFHHLHTVEEYRAIRRWGPLGHAWVWWWNGWAYRMEHRHWLSHGPFVSTAGRLVYLLCPPVFCVVVDLLGAGRRVTWTQHLRTLLIYVIWAGVVIGLTQVEPLVEVVIANSRIFLAVLAGVYVGWLVQDLFHLHLDGWRLHS